ncbi:hypothetical protein AB0H28_27255 [Micromonospora sp. NPDC050980]|uniref:hypothetical protein n=1 Tax=Micromonospora sp. NPDC050980 TaxID=3155161 RepID=UPI003401B9B1
MPADQVDEATSRLIQTRLRELFAADDEDRPPYTEVEVARVLTARGHRISVEGIRKLLQAPRINPKATTLCALADFFGVPKGYLLGDDEPEPTSQMARVMARSFDELSPRSRTTFARLIDEMRELEKAAGAATEHSGAAD